MPIRVTCECGQVIVTRDEYAGRRVQCKACKKILTLPGKPMPARPAATTQLAPPSKVDLDIGPEPTAPPKKAIPAASPPPTAPPLPPPSAPQTMMMPAVEAPAVPPRPAPASPSLIRYRCVCSFPYQSRAEHVGRPVRCPLCAHVLFVPKTSAEAVPPPPARARTRSEGGGRAVAIALFVLLLVAGGAGAALLLIRPLQTSGKQQGEPALLEESDFIPNGAALVLTARGTQGERLMTAAGLAPVPIPGVRADDIERRQSVLTRGSEGQRWSWQMVKTRQPAPSQALPNPENLELIKIRGQDYQLGRTRQGKALLAVGTSLLVIGDREGILHTVNPPEPALPATPPDGPPMPGGPMGGPPPGGGTPPGPPGIPAPPPPFRVALEATGKSTEPAVLVVNGRSAAFATPAAQRLFSYEALVLTVEPTGTQAKVVLELWNAPREGNEGPSKAPATADETTVKAWLPAASDQQRQQLLQFFKGQPTTGPGRHTLAGTLDVALAEILLKRFVDQANPPPAPPR